MKDLTGVTVAELVALLSGFVAKWSRVRALVRLPLYSCQYCGDLCRTSSWEHAVCAPCWGDPGEDGPF